MLRQIIRITLVVSIALFCQAVKADCGKIWIYPYNWGSYWNNGYWNNRGGQQPESYGTSSYEPDYQQLRNRNDNRTPVPFDTGSKEVEKLREELANVAELVKELTKRNKNTTLEPTQPKRSLTDNADPTKTKKPRGSGFVEKPKGGGSSAGYFDEPNQQAVIAWNGREDEDGLETLILTTNEQSTDGGKGYLLSVLPLPGEALRIEPANINVFMEAKILFYGKTPDGATVRNGSDAAVVKETKIGPHNIFVWYLEDVEKFQEDVQAWVAERFESEAAALITDETVDVLQYYFEKGFRYFAFDLTEVGNLSTKQAIAYTFRSNHVFFPLVISRIGGSDAITTVDLIIMTPEKITFNGAINEIIREDERMTADNQATLVRNGSVKFSIEEIEDLDPSLNVFDDNLSEATVRNIRFYRKLNGFTKDLTAVATVTEE